MLGDKISTNEIPAIEIKRLGNHGLLVDPSYITQTINLQ
jgi:hypothetical protein